MGRIDRLAERYKNYIALPWQKDLAGAQRAIFIVYDKVDERRLRARKDLVCHESRKVLLVTVGKMEECPPATPSRRSCQTTVSCAD